MMQACQTPILVVDDDAELRELVCALLREEGYPLVAEAPDGLEALLRLQLSSEPVVVLSNYHLPRVDGLRLLKALARGSPALQRHVGILMTGDERLLARTAGGSLRCLNLVCLRKPFHLSELLAAVTTASARVQQKMAACAEQAHGRRDRLEEHSGQKGRRQHQQVAASSRDPDLGATSLATSR
jgi:CheY-like chemotaxis protein